MIRRDAAHRLAVWRAHGATDDQAAELLAYAFSPVHQRLPERRAYPMPDAPCVSAWAGYTAEAAATSAEAVLGRVFVQLRFPIREGMSQDAAYLRATRRGLLPEAGADDRGLPHARAPRFVRPEGLAITLHPTPVGRVPVVLVEAREDFEMLVRTVTHRNEPAPVPASMGACLVAGYNNWDRMAALRAAHEAGRTGQPGQSDWAAAFQALLPQKALYQDRFMLLSAGPYSAVPAAAMGLSEEAWRRASIRLRLAHECTHYGARELLGAMRVSLLDELVADYFGLIEAFGAFRAADALRFMGLEAFPAYRAGSRFENYRGSPPLSDGAFALLPRVAVRAYEQLEAHDPLAGHRDPNMSDRARVLIALMRVGLEGLASDAAPARLDAALAQASAVVAD